MTKRIKILFTIPNFDTAGSGKVVYDLVKGLDKSRFEPEICCFHDKGAFFETVKTLGVPIHLFHFTTPYRPMFSFPFRVFTISRFFKKHRFDLIHSWHWSSDISEPLAAKLAGIPFVYTKKAMGWGSKYWTYRSQLSSKIITINDDMVNAYFSKSLSKVEPIALGIDTHYFQPNLSFDLNRTQLQIKSTDFVILTVANLVAVKGIEILIQAVQQLNQDSLQLLIVGAYDNDYGQWLKETYESETVRFFGKQMDVRSYLDLADVFVIPTKDEGRKEGLPIAPLEAMALGKIVIGSNISGIKDILKFFPNQLFEASNVEDLKAKLEYVIQLNKVDRQHLEQQMVAHVQTHYEMDQFINKHEALYKTLMP